MNLQIEPALFVASALVRAFARQADAATKEKKTYIDKLEGASGNDIFKYVLLINAASIEGYVALTRVQAEQAFRWSKGVSVVGFLIIATGVGVGIYHASLGQPVVNAAYLSALAGVFVELIAGVFFFLYNRTLQQLNKFHDRLAASQQVSLSFLSSSLVSDTAKRDEAHVALARAIAESARD